MTDFGEALDGKQCPSDEFQVIQSGEENEPSEVVNESSREDNKSSANGSLNAATARDGEPSECNGTTLTSDEVGCVSSVVADVINISKCDFELNDLEGEGDATQSCRIEPEAGKVKQTGEENVCFVCNKLTRCHYGLVGGVDKKFLCGGSCFEAFKQKCDSFFKADQQEQTLHGKSKICMTCGGEILNNLECFSTSTSSSGSKDFCSQHCLERFQQFLSSSSSIEENGQELISCETIRIDKQCDMCKAAVKDSTLTIKFGEINYSFCSPTCFNTFKAKKASFVNCLWCHVRRTSFDMIEGDENDGCPKKFCTLNCLSLYKVKCQANSSHTMQCDHCEKCRPAHYHISMTDSTVKNFCCYPCVKAFRRGFLKTSEACRSPQNLPQPQDSGNATRSKSPKLTERGKSINQTPQTSKLNIKHKSLLCKPHMNSKSTSCAPQLDTKSTQTDEDKDSKILMPCPVPLAVPVPLGVLSAPTLMPSILPVPVPVPCFVLTTKKSSDKIFKEIKELQDKVPSNHYEAEVLMMAEAIVGKSSGSDDDDEEEEEVEEERNRKSDPTGHDVRETEDMLQIALRLANEMTQEDHALDLEASVSMAALKTKEVPCDHQTADATNLVHDAVDANSVDAQKENKGRGQKKRSGDVRVGSTKSASNILKRHKMEEQGANMVNGQAQANQLPAQESPVNSNHFLKFTYGVNAYKHWILMKNAEIESSYKKQNSTSTPPTKNPRLFKLDLLQASTDELNRALSLFVKEVRKPSGEEYSPDGILYLCLGIQEHLHDGGRVDNIFTDHLYERFSDSLNELLSQYEVRLNAQGLLVCRISEEHLWECKQLGAHSPHVLLNTLFYFNMKCFLLKSAQQHATLSFSHIIKQWKKTGSYSNKQGKSIFLRYCNPSQIGSGDQSQKKRKDDTSVLEQAENLENPLRCPVKLYEFYISKCPESIKNRSDVFYLVPERSCIPDSPVWYSTQSFSLDGISKIFNRLQVVREIQEAFLSNMTQMFP